MAEKLSGLKPGGVGAFRARGAEGVVVREEEYQESRYYFSDIPVKGKSLVMVVTDRERERVGVIPDELRKSLQNKEMTVEDVEGQIKWYGREAAAEGRAVPVPAAA